MCNIFNALGKRKTSLLIILSGIVFFCMIGCDSKTRYKILTFFFEGVPSPDGKGSRAADVNIVAITNVDMLNMERSKGRVIEPDKYGQKLASRHEFVKDCAQCHTGDLRSGQQELRKPLPELCYSCHSDLHDGDNYLHGPLYVGECVFCHDPHQSPYIHLQKEPLPRLCYQCHLKEDIELIDEHFQYLEGLCTDCHDTHGSSEEKLLKSGWQELTDSNDIE